MNLINSIKNNVEHNPQKIALIDEKRTITFQQLDSEIQNVSNFLFQFNEKNVITIISENSIDFIISYLATINSGIIAHLISPETTEINLKNQIVASDSGAILCNPTIKENFLKLKSFSLPIISFDEMRLKQEIRDVQTKSNEFAYLIYTSGTTSEPKGVPISHSMIEFTTKNIIDILGYSDNDINLVPLPLNHSFGLGCVHTSLMIGSTLILQKNSFNLKDILNSIKKFNITTFAAIPATLTKLLQFDENIINEYFSKVRLIITNSTSIPENTVKNFKIILKNGHLATYYGLTEASRSTFMIFDEKNKRENSVGKLAPGVEIKIVNEDNDELKIGEIWIKGQNVIKKYWNNPNADKNIVNGWLKTGDLGNFDDEKYLFLQGRNDEVINIGGEKVIPSEIEDVVKELPDVEEVVAFGIEHEIFGEVIKLNIVKTKKSLLEKSDILKYCVKNLEKYKIPAKIEFVEKIPKTDYGKVKRFMLK